MSDKVILLAVSGGMDSMVMLHRMTETHGRASLSVAHCNFQLRGEESDEDERFVRRSCDLLNIPFHTQRFMTGAHALEQGLSIQEAARQLRYAWFFRLMEQHGYSALATAHHLDDSIETFFINLLRGTGPKGLSGISDDTERQIIRPLMDMDKASVHQYALKHGVQWREDSSNASWTYLRNAIRHEVIPALEALRPGFRKVMRRNMSQQAALSALLERAIEGYRSKFFLSEGDRIRIGIEGRDTDLLILGHALRPYGFTVAQVESLLTTKESGKQVLSVTHVLSTHRADLLLSPMSSLPEGPWHIGDNLDTSELPFDLDVQRLAEAPMDLDPDPHIAYLDDKALVFPVTVRRWKEGDRLRPLGMRGTKLVSDLLNDLKLPVQEKDRTYVMLSGDDIAWVIGKRISDVFKCREGHPCLQWRCSPQGYI